MRNPNLETRNKFENRNSNSLLARPLLSRFEFRICFGFRYSSSKFRSTPMSRDLSLKTPPPAAHKSCKLGESKSHVIAYHEFPSNPSLQSVRFFFATSPSLQSGPAVTTLLGIARAPTSVVRVRAQKNVRSRAQGNAASRAIRTSATVEPSLVSFLAASEWLPTALHEGSMHILDAVIWPASNGK
jgi:hypothetical protein